MPRQSHRRGRKLQRGYTKWARKLEHDRLKAPIVAAVNNRRRASLRKHNRRKDQNEQIYDAYLRRWNEEDNQMPRPDTVIHPANSTKPLNWQNAMRKVRRQEHYERARLYNVEVGKVVRRLHNRWPHLYPQ